MAVPRLRLNPSCWKPVLSAPIQLSSAGSPEGTGCLALDIRFKELVTLVEAFEKTAKPSSEIKQVQLQSIKNIQGLVGELDSYWGIIRGIQVLGQ